MIIRPATLADVFSIVSLERESASAGHWTEQQYREAIAPESVGRLVVVAEQTPPASAGSSLLGFLVARHVHAEWELENIVVAAASRRTGLGKRLLDELLNAARARNSESVFLEVRESNVVARSLYERAGFRASGRRKSYYSNPIEDAVVYRLTM